ncbi:MAG: TonB-dependent receptor [Henriciella sp.]|jgi:iron complex outermembrane receptor protein|uniref:TonB-dependent receptor n=1 Tax=Henriciella sp. TaxID=1968823 RepID=UPI000C0E40D3|nr:TonB-dependent receptor [Henriciella sp.]MAN74924.1 TonB-dependent receptor [Henriciella sp.]MBF33880.1 TonB-dependent receptor [Hyphomonadaceae bacterium]PHR79761.1 MAG: TonB-dependent receptor [Henriciella sp.]|tara:strand:- start:15503 stop:17686 length:2184 start_codon:yes stop_codon:yes gene_type:complete
MTSRILRRTLAATLLMGASPIAFAQNAASAPETDAPERLSTVIVSGVGPQRDTDEMIGNASVVTRDQIVETLQASLGNTLDSEPGVSTTHFGQAASRPVLRGLGAERVLVLTNGIGVIDASAASPDHQVASDGIDAEKIEILRGPAALAYGGQAIGGVVNVIDGLIVEELPDEPVSGEAYGALNGVSDGEEGAVKGRFTTGPFVLSLSASARDFDDYDIPGFAESSRLRASEEHDHEHEEEEGEDHDEHEGEEVRDTLENSFVETESFAGGLSWVGDGAFAGLAIRRQTSTYGLPGHSHAHGHEGEEHEGEDHEEEEGHEEGHEEEQPFIDLEQTRYDFRAGADLDYGPFTRIAGNVSIANYEHTEFEAPGEPGTRYESEGTEGRLEVGTSVGEWEGAIGLQALDKTLDAFGDEAFITETDTTSTGVFLYQTREWDNGFGVEGGLRYDATELDNARFGTREFDLFSGSFGLHQHWDNGWFVGGQVSLTERAPNESELFADGAHLATEQYEVGNADLDKERGVNFEGTVRWRGDNGFGIGANLFHTEFDGFIYLTPGQTLEDDVLVDEIDELPVYLFVQQDASFTGGEIYADYTLQDGPLGADWRAEANVDFVSSDIDGGGDVPLLPPTTFNASLDGDWGLWKAGASVTVAGDQDDPGEGQLPTDGYTTLDLRGAFSLADVGFGSEGTELFLEARNVTDEEVRYATSVLKDTVPAPGRNIRGGVRIVF